MCDTKLRIMWIYHSDLKLHKYKGDTMVTMVLCPLCVQTKFHFKPIADVHHRCLVELLMPTQTKCEWCGE